MNFNRNIKIENIGFGNMKLIQNHDYFCYGIDAVILADFAVSIIGSFNIAIDLGTGTGIIPFILSHKNPKEEYHVTGIEVQEESVRLAGESCEINNLQGKINFLREDVKNIADGSMLTYIPMGEADLVCSNPPYVAKGAGMTNDSSAKFIARHETTAELEDFVIAAAGLLKDKGHFCMVHRPSRLVDIFCLCRKHGLEPKDIRFVAPKAGEIPNIVLVHCVLGGGKELKYHPTLNVYDENGNYTEEIERIYERTK